MQKDRKRKVVQTLKRLFICAYRVLVSVLFFGINTVFLSLVVTVFVYVVFVFTVFVKISLSCQCSLLRFVSVPCKASLVFVTECRSCLLLCWVSSCWCFVCAVDVVIEVIVRLLNHVLRLYRHSSSSLVTLLIVLLSVASVLVFFVFSVGLLKIQSAWYNFRTVAKRCWVVGWTSFHRQCLAFISSSS